MLTPSVPQSVQGHSTMSAYASQLLASLIFLCHIMYTLVDDAISVLGGWLFPECMLKTLEHEITGLVSWCEDTIRLLLSLSIIQAHNGVWLSGRHVLRMKSRWYRSKSNSSDWSKALIWTWGVMPMPCTWPRSHSRTSRVKSGADWLLAIVQFTGST